MLIRIISNVQSFALGIVEPFIKLLHEDNNDDDEGKCNDVLSRLSFSSNPSCDLGRNSPTTNSLGVIAKSSYSLSRPLVMKVICGCIKALPLPVKSFFVTSVGQLKPLVESVASLDILGLVKDDNLLCLISPADSCLVATTSELVVASSTDLVTANDQDTLVGIDKEESYSPNALDFVLNGCLIILLAFGCGIIRSGTAILCLSIFQVVILEYNYQMISSFIAVMSNTSSSNADSADKDGVAKDEELAATTLRSSSLRLGISSSASSNELIVPIDVAAAIVDRSNSSDVSAIPYKPCLIAFLLLIFTSSVEIVDILSVVPCLISFLPMVFTSLIDIVDTLSAFNGIDWLILITLVGSTMMFISSTCSKQHALGSDVETTDTSVSSASDDVDNASLALRSADDIQSQETSDETNSTSVPFNLMVTLRACLSSGLQHIFYERHDLLVAILLMACAPILVIMAVLMVLLNSWTILQALAVANCLFHITTYITKALRFISTRLRGSTSALINRVYRLNPITTIGNIISDESCLITFLLMVIVPLMGIVVVMMMLFLVSFNWSVVVQVLVESCLPSVTQACGVVMLMMCLRTITYYLLRMWQYQLSIAFTFLDVIGAFGPLVNCTSQLLILISFALAHYDGGGGGVHITRGGMLTSATVRIVTPPTGLVDTVRGILYSATTHTLNSIWMIIAWVVKKFVYLIAYMSILLVHVIIMMVRSIYYKAAVYRLVTYLIRLPINIVWGLVGRLVDALLGCIVYLYTGIKLFIIIKPSNQAEQKEPLLPDGVAISDDEDSDDDNSTIDFGAAADQIDDVDIDQSVPPPPPPPKRRARRRRKEYPPAVWHRGRGGRGGRLRPRPPKPG